MYDVCECEYSRLLFWHPIMKHLLKNLPRLVFTPAVLLVFFPNLFPHFIYPNSSLMLMRGVSSSDRAFGPSLHSTSLHSKPLESSLARDLSVKLTAANHSADGKCSWEGQFKGTDSTGFRPGSKFSIRRELSGFKLLWISTWCALLNLRANRESVFQGS